MVSVAYGQGRIQGSTMRGMHPPTSHFENVFDVGLYNFFINLNLFHCNKPYALSTRKSNVCEQNASYLAKHSELR